MLSEGSPGARSVDSLCRSQICAAIVTHNIGQAIHRCFDSIRDQVGHVVIVDNGSGEPTRRELNRLAESHSVTVILNKANEGLARALNQAVHWARDNRYRWILTLDHDSEATPGMVDRLVQAYTLLERQGTHNVGVLGANPYDRNTQVFTTGVPPRVAGGLPLEDTDVISSGSLFPSHVFEDAGPFNEALFVYYVDDDFCLRLRKAGYRVFFCPEAVLLHEEGRYEARKFLWRRVFYDCKTRQARYYLSRNMIYMLKNHHLSAEYIYWVVRRFCKDHVKILIFDKNRFSMLWFSLKGLTDGLRGRVGRLEPNPFKEPRRQ